MKMEKQGIVVSFKIIHKKNKKIKKRGFHEKAHSVCYDCAVDLEKRAQDSNKPFLCPLCRQTVVQYLKNFAANNLITLPGRVLAEEKKKLEKKSRQELEELEREKERIQQEKIAEIEQLEREKERVTQEKQAEIEELKDELRRQREEAEQARQRLEEEKRIEEERRSEEENQRRKQIEEARRLQRERERQEQVNFERQRQLEEQIQQLNNAKSSVEAEKENLMMSLLTNKQKLSAIVEDTERSKEEKLRLQQEVATIEAKLQEVQLESSKQNSNKQGVGLFSNLLEYLPLTGKSSNNFIHYINQYKIIQTLGCKRNSRVKKAILIKKKETVALKESLYFPAKSNLVNYFRPASLEELKQYDDFKIQCFREPMLRFLFRNCNTINSISAIVQTNYAGKIYQALPYMEYDLAYLIEQAQSINNTTNVTIYDPSLVKCILFKIVCGISTLHSSEVVHLNISPVSILLTPTNRTLFDVQLGCLSKAISTQSIDTQEHINVKITNYSAPELCGKWSRISNWKAVDMWAIGCIFVQLLGATQPIFTASSGAHLLTQIKKIVVDTPDYFSFIQDKDGRDLVQSLLAEDPLKRPTAQKVLSHPFFSGMSPLDRDIVPRSASECMDDKISLFIDSNCPL